MGWMARATLLDSNNFFAGNPAPGAPGFLPRPGKRPPTGSGGAPDHGFSLKVDVWPIDGSASPTGTGPPLTTWSAAFPGPQNPGQGPRRPACRPPGVDGTLEDRMRGSCPGNCHAKTGTLTGVSALSGYCFNSSGRRFAGSILMNDDQPGHRPPFGTASPP